MLTKYIYDNKLLYDNKSNILI